MYVTRDCNHITPRLRGAGAAVLRCECNDLCQTPVALSASLSARLPASTHIGHCARRKYYALVRMCVCVCLTVRVHRRRGSRSCLSVRFVYVRVRARARVCVSATEMPDWIFYGSAHSERELLPPSRTIIERVCVYLFICSFS